MSASEWLASMTDFIVARQLLTPFQEQPYVSGFIVACQPLTFHTEGSHTFRVDACRSHALTTVPQDDFRTHYAAPQIKSQEAFVLRKGVGVRYIICSH